MVVNDLECGTNNEDIKPSVVRGHVVWHNIATFSWEHALSSLMNLRINAVG
jgi:hypothetical protein